MTTEWNTLWLVWRMMRKDAEDAGAGYQTDPTCTHMCQENANSQESIPLTQIKNTAVKIGLTVSEGLRIQGFLVPGKDALVASTDIQPLTAYTHLWLENVCLITDNVVMT